MRWSSFEQLNVWLGARCKALWRELPHPNESHSTVADILEIERTFMMRTPTPFDGYANKNARVSSTCLVTFAKNRYSVPCELAGQQVSLRVYPTKVCIAANEQIVASQVRLRDAAKEQEVSYA